MSSNTYKLAGLLGFTAIALILITYCAQRTVTSTVWVDRRKVTDTNGVTSGLAKQYQIPDDAELSQMDMNSLLQLYWRYINMLHILCKDVVRVGSLHDGGKEICVDKLYKPKAPCLVYSFGIANKWDFDEAVVDLFGCDVHCFDPRYKFLVQGISRHPRQISRDFILESCSCIKKGTQRVSKNIWFYKWGLGGENQKNKNGWEIKTLDTIRRELGHTNRTIDILKMDIEGSEWKSIPQMASSGTLSIVRQISMEVHWRSSKDNTSYRQLSALRQLYDLGFRTFVRERNLHGIQNLPGKSGSKMTTVLEVSMIKPE